MIFITKLISFLILFGATPAFQFQKLNQLNSRHGGVSVNSLEVDSVESTPAIQPSEKRISHISSIISRNLAAVAADEDGKEIVMNFEATSDASNLMVAVTGETGSGKSLLVSKVADLVTGGKMIPSLLHNTKSTSIEPEASVEMVLKLYGAHVALVEDCLMKQNLDANMILGDHQSFPLELKLQRSLSISQSSGRIRSECFVNGHRVTLKALRAIGSPLLAIVNAPTAASHLGKPHSRMAMIDTGVPSEVLTWVRQLQTTYKKCKRNREKLEKEISSYALPASLDFDRDKDIELMGHWVEELDGFEGRIKEFCLTLSSNLESNDSPLARRIEDLVSLAWMDSDGDDTAAFSSILYRKLLEFLNYVISLERRIEAAAKARDSLNSLSMPDSAITALDRTRKLLLDATTSDEAFADEDDSREIASSEKAHQLLNHVEDALAECSNFLDGETGLLACLEAERSSCSVSLDAINEIIFEWNTLARKHGISAYLLPSCHASLRLELNGNIEAKRLLPEAIKEERQAKKELLDGSQMLSEARKKLANQVSKSISERLPLLGMETSSFEACIRTVDSTYESGLSSEEVDFMLLHDKVGGLEEHGNVQSTSRGGKVDSVASSGEKARILLAIECEIPGSVRALCGDSDSTFEGIGPVAVIYDEIDAHVGGRASVSVAQMLSDQSRSCQVLSITHSPSVAAIADLHICINKKPPVENGRVIASATHVEGSTRRKELARMASGDMATEEAEIFAEALIRDVVAKKSKLKP